MFLNPCNRISMCFNNRNCTDTMYTFVPAAEWLHFFVVHLVQSAECECVCVCETKLVENHRGNYPFIISVSNAVECFYFSGSDKIQFDFFGKKRKKKRKERNKTTCENYSTRLLLFTAGSPSSPLTEKLPRW